ncbi:Trehalose-phosphatase [Lachancea thermotolerans]|uniref:KLTH0H07546p n=1 Tax=Lachancea thermotolerans (strain ATCC 56472 / CBS 6340 / NRRL Y-8284) TaxID=559295 RepID=C5E2T4_LACTC|nr:KLTH0H07546p [Lachancea thermotolerans CBS 6340]CAR30345.1 KLTH0H07546p [Lachancea thermotolerans CBS 6340]
MSSDKPGTAEKPVSGRIINCVPQLPYKVSRNDLYTPGENQDPGDEWKLTPISGNSALYSSLYLLRDSPDWEEHVVGWTGEIDPGNKFAYVAPPNQRGTQAANDNARYNSQESNEDPLYLSQEQKRVIAEKLQDKEDSNNKMTVHPVWLLRRDQLRWREYSDKIVWPALHYILNPPSDGQKENTWWYDYVKFNEAYALKVAQIYQPGDIIWVHDYYLMLLPQLLRMRFGDAIIAYFHHTPWPSSEYFRCLSKRKQLLDGILGSNRVCFQNDGFSRHFVSACKRLLDSTSTKKKSKGKGRDEWVISVYGGDVVVDSLPIGVNTEEILRKAFTEDIDEKVKVIKEAYANKKIIFGRDRLDTVRGVVQKLQAFEAFLAMYPEYRDKVVLIQVSRPTATDQGLKLEQQVNDLVNSINAQYGTLNSSPVHHYHVRIPEDAYHSLLRAADLCLITSARDGMNTTALEYVTVKSRSSIDGCYANPLVLSEFSGTSTVLKDALIVNPWDAVAVARTIKKALCLTAQERVSLEMKLWSKVPTIQDWNNSFLQRMVEIAKHESQDNKITPALNRPLLLQAYRAAKRRLFLFDYDGTLTPIVQDPAAAIPSARLFRILSKLAADPHNLIWIISGRDQQFLSKWLGSRMPQLGLSAEHGCFMKDVSSEEWVNLTTKYDMTWQEKVNEAMEQITVQTPGSFIEKKKVAVTWHYRRADPEQGEFLAGKLKASLEKFSKDLGLEVMEGKANLEVRPKFVNKGEIVKRLVWHPYGEKQLNEDEFKQDDTVPKSQLPDFVLCLGDDFTDEDMFNQLNDIESVWDKKFPDDKNEAGHYGIYPVTVGSASKKTVAKAHLTDPQQVLDTLGLLVGDVSLFQSPGTVELDDRGHVKDSESSVKSEQAGAAYNMKRSASLKDNA